MLRARCLATAALTLALLVPLTGCDDDATPRAADRAALSGEESSNGGRHVLAVSVDGLNTKAITQLRKQGTPTLHRLLAEGAGTLNARTEFEQTVTLPNHASMVTGRRIDAGKGGHGVTWDDDRPGSTVQQAAGHAVASIFSKVHASDGSTALYSTKAKFGLYQRSWPRGIDSFAVRQNQKRLVGLARADLLDGAPTFTFLHVSLPDRSGHADGGMSSSYLEAVRRTDAQLGRIVRTVAGSDLTVVLTSDHGFATGAKDHSARTELENYRIPFLVWGAGVHHGDLYEMNPRRTDPGAGRPSYVGKQPVRNGDLANLAATVLGLEAVPGSSLDADESLTVN